MKGCRIFVVTVFIAVITTILCNQTFAEEMNSNKIDSEANLNKSTEGSKIVFNMIRIEFSEPTNQPVVSTKEDVDRLFSFSQNLGANYVGSWTNPSTLVLGVNDTVGSTANPGVLLIKLKQTDILKNGKGTSPVYIVGYQVFVDSEKKPTETSIQYLKEVPQDQSMLDQINPTYYTLAVLIAVIIIGVIIVNLTKKKKVGEIRQVPNYTNEPTIDDSEVYKKWKGI